MEKIEEKTMMGRSPVWKDRVYHIPLADFLKGLNLEGSMVMEIKMVTDDTATLIIRTRGE